MLTNFFAYTASKAAGDAVDEIARRAVWGGLAAVLLLFSFAMALIVGYWLLEPRFGAVQSVALLASGCALGSLLALSLPGLLQKSKKATATANQEPGAAPQIAASVPQDDEAVDYFAAVQVVASAFMFGLGAARQIRRQA